MHAPAKNHIMVDEKGVARVDDTRMKVRLLIEAWMAGGRSVEQLRQGYPQLSLAQLYAVLAYYYDHQAQIDDEIEAALAQADALFAAAPETPLRQKLRDLGLRP